MDMEMGDERVVSCFESLSVAWLSLFLVSFLFGELWKCVWRGCVCVRVCLRLLACFVKMHKSPTFIFIF